MMNDNRLLELAAKAAGSISSGPDGFWNFESDGWWNPLTDDGDAMRLAIKLRIDFQFDGEKVEAWFVAPRPGWDNGAVWSWSEPLGDDPYAATRRAIVLAAANIGAGTTAPEGHNAKLCGERSESERTTGYASGGRD